MITPRGGFGAAALGGRLYAVGGWSGAGHYFASAECYDPRENRWRQVAQQQHACPGDRSVPVRTKVEDPSTDPCLKECLGRFSVHSRAYDYFASACCTALPPSQVAPMASPVKTTGTPAAAAAASSSARLDVALRVTACGYRGLGQRRRWSARVSSVHAATAQPSGQRAACAGACRAGLGARVGMRHERGAKPAAVERCRYI